MKLSVEESCGSHMLRYTAAAETLEGALRALREMQFTEHNPSPDRLQKSLRQIEASPDNGDAKEWRKCYNTALAKIEKLTQERDHLRRQRNEQVHRVVAVERERYELTKQLEEEKLVVESYRELVKSMGAERDALRTEIGDLKALCDQHRADCIAAEAREDVFKAKLEERGIYITECDPDFEVIDDAVAPSASNPSEPMEVRSCESCGNSATGAPCYRIFRECASYAKWEPPENNNTTSCESCAHAPCGIHCYELVGSCDEYEKWAPKENTDENKS